jgi:hypothetical protein
MTMGGMPFMRWTHWVAIALMAGCTAAPPAATLDTVAEGYVRVALQLAQHDPTLVEVWRGPSSWRPGPRVPVAPLLQRIESLRHELTQVPGTDAPERRDYLAAQLRALELSARRLLGESSTFAAEALAGFDYVVPTLNEGEAAMAREALARELPGTQPLDARYAAFKQQLTVPAEKAEALMRAALAACRTATVQSFAMPADESTELVFKDDSPWDGAALYLGGHRTRITVNRRAAMDVSRALRLACHEGYPGHHWQFMLIDEELVQRRGWQEFNLAPMFGRHLFVNEGAAEVGADLAFPDEARRALYRDVLFPLAGLPIGDAAKLVRVEGLVASLEPVTISIIGDYLDGQVTHDVAANRLRQEALTLEPDALLAFAERYRARVLAYPGGRSVVRAAIGTGGARALRQLYIDRPFAVP